MRKRVTFALIVFCALSYSSASARTRYVNNTSNTSICPLQYTTIQAAVNAATANDTVFVCAGTYNEQVEVKMPLTLTGQSGATIAPTNAVANPAINAAVLLYVHDTAGVSVSNLTFDGSLSGLTNCAPDFYGVYFSNASGSFTHNAIKFIQTPPNYGCQTGLSLLVDNPGGASQSISIQANSIHDFQKNGITVVGPKVAATISGNVVSGFGPTTQTAQNGFEIDSGTTGTISGNSLNGMAYIACPGCIAYAATGMLILDSPGLTVTSNTLTETNVGIYYSYNFGSPTALNATITSNRISDSLIYDGIDVVGDASTVSGNTITHSDESGVYVYGNGNKVNSNTIIETPIGLYLDGGSTVSQTGNKFFVVPQTVYSAPAPGTASSVKRATVSPAHK